MLDLKEEQCSVSEDQSNPSSTTASPGGGSGSSSSSTSCNGDVIKRCTDCQTTTTPLWRGGPAGPKTLCNACGIKFHKKRRALLGIDKGKSDKNKKKSSKNSATSINGSNLGGSGMPLKIKVIASGINRQRENLEVEQAAMLLMALSYGSVYA